jgi:hypothetical protein
MAETINVVLTAQQVLDALKGLCPRPPPPLAGSACRSAVDALAALIDVAADLDFEVPAPQALLDEIHKWKTRAEDLQKQIEELLGSAPTLDGPASPLPGGDPLLPLRRLAEAINEAESLLNSQNLVIAGGTVDVQLTVAVGGASAGANVKLDIAPRPPQ